MSVPSSIATRPARLMPGTVVAADRMANAYGRRHADAESDHGCNHGNLKRDLMSRECTGADQATGAPQPTKPLYCIREAIEI